jgi:5'-nucleotidase
VEEIGARVIGQAAVRLVHLRGAESPLGDLIVDAMRGADLGDGVAFDIALHNDGGIRADVDAGPVTYAEMYAVLPFDNNLVGLDLTGAQVKEMIESGVNNQGSEIQVSGARFVCSLIKLAGRRVMEVTVGGAPLDLERTYRVATIDYLYTHPQYEDSLGQGTNVFYGGLCLDAVVDYIKAHSPVEPQTEGRIRKM